MKLLIEELPPRIYSSYRDRRIIQSCSFKKDVFLNIHVTYLNQWDNNNYTERWRYDGGWLLSKSRGR